MRGICRASSSRLALRVQVRDRLVPLVDSREMSCCWSWSKWLVRPLLLASFRSFAAALPVPFAFACVPQLQLALPSPALGAASPRLRLPFLLAILPFAPDIPSPPAGPFCSASSRCASSSLANLPSLCAPSCPVSSLYLAFRCLI